MFFRPRAESTPKNRNGRLLVEELESRLVMAATLGSDLVWKPYADSEIFQLHSNPGARQVIYLDFDGETVSGTQWNTDANGGNAFTCEPWSIDSDRNSFSSVERQKIIEVWRMVAEDFMPFDVNVTTAFPGLEALRKVGASDNAWGIRVIICPVPDVSDDSFFSGAGGIAYLNSFDWDTDTPAFAFNGDSDPAPEGTLPVTISHEVGHTLGLDHDGDGSQEYYPGHGSGVTAWGPIMGAPFYINLTQWSRATYPGANNNEDDLSIITTGHGFGYRADDFGNTSAGAKAMNGAMQATLKTTYGIIEKNNDVDYLSFYADPGPINIKIDMLFVGPNLDIKADLYSPSGKLIATSNPANDLDATFNLNVTEKGRYRIRVDGTGLIPFNTTGYPDYGSLGNYRITGDVTPFTPTASAFRSMNPKRWIFNSGVYSGTLTIANTTKLPFRGTFTIELTLPSSSIQILSPNGTQNGNKFTFTFTGTIAKGNPLRLLIRLTNPDNLYLGTGYNTFVTSIQTESGDDE